MGLEFGIFRRRFTGWSRPGCNCRWKKNLPVIACPMPVNPADARRRWFGVFFLIIATGMLIWGQTFLKPYLEGLEFVIYWLACMGFTALAMGTALLDIWAVRRRTRDQQRDLIRRIFDNGKSNQENESDKPDAH